MEVVKNGVYHAIRRFDPESNKAGPGLSGIAEICATQLASKMKSIANKMTKNQPVVDAGMGPGFHVAPCFLNVDLDIISRSKLDPLATAMGKRVIVLHSGPTKKQHLLVLESSRSHKGPDATIHAFCAIIESLPPEARRVWTAAKKVFNVGYELRFAERSLSFTLRPDTLQRLSALGATLTVTCYYFGDPKLVSPQGATPKVSGATEPKVQEKM
jgi:hypothetical protein